MNFRQELHLHQYRKLHRESDPFHHSIECNTNFTDSRLKFQRNFVYMLKQLYLVLQTAGADALSEKQQK